MFRNAETAEMYGLTPQDVGEVKANETRDVNGVQKSFVTILFDAVEVNGQPAELFQFIEGEEKWH